MKPTEKEIEKGLEEMGLVRTADPYERIKQATIAPELTGRLDGCELSTAIRKAAGVRSSGGPIRVPVLTIDCGVCGVGTVVADRTGQVHCVACGILIAIARRQGSALVFDVPRLPEALSVWRWPWGAQWLTWAHMIALDVHAYDAREQRIARVVAVRWVRGGIQVLLQALVHGREGIRSRAIDSSDEVPLARVRIKGGSIHGPRVDGKGGTVGRVRETITND